MPISFYRNFYEIKLINEHIAWPVKNINQITTQMDYSLPDVPENLTAKNTAANITKQSIDHATQLYNKCLAEIGKQKFPCHLFVGETESKTILSAISCKLEKAGYKAKVGEELFVEYGQRDDPYNVKKMCITIENPLLPL